jgi:hypothetical protein
MTVHVNIVTAKTVAATSEVIIVKIVFATARENNDAVTKTVKGADIIANIFFRSRSK